MAKPDWTKRTAPSFRAESVRAFDVLRAVVLPAPRLSLYPLEGKIVGRQGILLLMGGQTNPESFRERPDRIIDLRTRDPGPRMLGAANLGDGRALFES